MSWSFRDSPWAPFTGMFVGALAWFADQQISASAVQVDCRTYDGAFAVAVGVVCILVTAAAGVASWRLRPLGQSEEGQSRKFARIVGAGAAAIFILAIAFGTLAGALLPGCQR